MQLSKDVVFILESNVAILLSICEISALRTLDGRLRDQTYYRAFFF